MGALGANPEMDVHGSLVEIRANSGAVEVSVRWLCRVIRTEWKFREFDQPIRARLQTGPNSRRTSNWPSANSAQGPYR